MGPGHPALTCQIGDCDTSSCTSVFLGLSCLRVAKMVVAAIEGILDNLSQKLAALLNKHSVFVTPQ